MTISAYDLDRLEDIKEQIKELVYEAQDVLPNGSMVKDRALSYWIPHILMALDNGHDYLGGSMCTMEETIEELREEAYGTE